MSKPLVGFLAVLALVVGFAVPAAIAAPAEKEIDALMQGWIAALRSKNLNRMMEAYWPDAVRVVVQPGQPERRLRGVEEIRRQQREFFDGRAGFAELRYPEPERNVKGNNARFVYRVEGPGFRYVEHFVFSKKAGKWKIAEQILEMLPGSAGEAAEGPREAVPVAGEFQAWADGNRNRILEPAEQEELLRAVAELLRDPHPTRTQADRFFDANNDGQIDHREMQKARSVLLVEQLRRLTARDPDLARLFDLNGDRFIALWELTQTSEMMAFRDFIQPREVRSPFEARLDRNNDRRVDEREIQEYRMQILRLVSFSPLDLELIERRYGTKEALRAWFDVNTNGRLDPPEQADVATALRMSLGNPKESTLLPLGEFFDRNRNGLVDEPEWRRALEQLTAAAVRRFQERAPDDLLKAADRNRDGRLEASELADALPERELPDAQQQAAQRVRTAVGLAWLESPESAGERLAVRSALDKLADLDRDGFVNPDEERQLAESLQGPHRTASEFDRRIDANKNGEVEAVEIMRARRAGEISEKGAEEAPRSFPVRTPVDALLDLNADKQVDGVELEMAVSFLQKIPGRTEGNRRLYDLFDLNRNGTASPEEARQVREMYFQPHPVNQAWKLDKELDANRDGFISPEEIGIAAGVSGTERLPSLEQRAEKLSWEQAEQPAVAAKEPAKKTSESDFYKKLGIIQDKKLAVVGISSGTKNVDQETAGGVMVFIENAFVNVGKVRVVDRQNIAKIVKEYEFQASELTDETTAVKIGRLSGADIIVIGSISYVGEQYYLNIKLIAVETGEIIGSSIADASQASEFYDMCNEAVFTLF
jgi:Ca2+-binding EF-hand superfamily protein/ketosteroid isomerase-like protein